ncbi:MAG: phosphoenolpyruvate carboxykinase (ATP), partial [Oleiphilaceae bacterium]
MKLIDSLKDYNINTTSEILHNPDYDTLFNETTKSGLSGFEKGFVTESGAVCVKTGKFT